MSFEKLLAIAAASPVAKALIDKVFKVIGDFREPSQIRRLAEANKDATIIQAEAEKEAAIIKAQGEIEISDIQRRAVFRFVQEQGKQQENMENIMGKAIPELNKAADASKVDDDWMADFFGKSRMVSNEEMQKLWARVLAGEVNKPGSFSKRTLSLIADLDKKDAQAFAALCAFSLGQARDFPIVTVATNEIYTANGVSYDSLMQLDSIGLAKFSGIGSFSMGFQGGPLVFMNYFGKVIALKPPKPSIPIGMVTLTKVGKELASLTSVKEVAGFYEHLLKYWSSILDRTYPGMVVPPGT